MGMIKKMQEALNESFVERSDVIDGMLVALLAKENIFLLGPPGTSKSALSNALCRMVGGKFFSHLMGKTTTPEELYGPVSFKALQDDRYERNTAGKLPEADIAFLDEIWKGSSAINNTLLPIINERIFFNGAKPQQIPLQMLFAASNETPQGEELGAMWDRFALRYVTQSIQVDDNFKQVFRKGISKQMPQFSIADLEAEQQKAMALDIPDDILDVICEIRRECVQRGIYVSDRKWIQASGIIRAQAYLQDHQEVQEEDLEILQHVLWHTPEQISEVRKLVMSFCNPIGEQLVEIQDAVIEIQQQLKTVKKDEEVEFGMAAVEKFKVLNKKLAKLKKEHPRVSKVDDLKNFSTSVLRDVQAKTLGLV